MGTQALTHQKVAREAAAILEEEAPFIMNVNRGRQDEFGSEIDGYSVGQTVRIKIPPVPQVYSGAVFAGGGAPTNSAETSVNLTLDQQSHVPLLFGAREKLLDITDYRERFLRPAMQALASVVEAQMIQRAVRATPNVVGTWGTIPSAMLTYAQARTVLQRTLAPSSDRSVLFSSDANQNIVDTSRVLFHNSEQINRGFLRGSLGEAQGAQFYEHQSIPVHTNGNQASWTVNGANQTGSTLNIGGLTTSQTILAGTVFTIAGVNAIHPLTGQDMSVLQQFVVTADFTAAGTTGSISIFPAITPTWPNRTVLASPGNGVTCTPFGTASQSRRQNLMFQKDAYTVATAPLPVLASCEGYTARLPSGISVRVMTFGDGLNDQERTRIDILWGFAAVRPQHACRITE